VTDSDEFSEDDKLFFTELVELGLKPILLTRRHLEMSYLDVGDYRHRGAGLGRSGELLSRLTIIDTLGKSFADAHYLWV
jgi:hypothetical protein